MSPTIEDRLRKRLEEELARVNASVVAIKKEPRAQELEGFGDNTPLSEEVDSISVTEQQELDAERLAALLDRAAALDEALHRLDRGDYGRCVSCGIEIPKNRLEAVPEAAYCTRCGSDAERRQTAGTMGRSAKWKSAKEIYEKREAFDVEGFDRHPKRVEDMSELAPEGESSE